MVDYLDLSHLHSILKENPSRLVKLADLFKKNATTSITTLQQSIDDVNHEQWKSTSHKLKGLAMNIGSEAMSEICEHAEKHYSTSQEEKEAMFLKIQKEFEKTLEALDHAIKHT